MQQQLIDYQHQLQHPSQPQLAQRYGYALQQLIESRERNLPRFKRIAKLAARQEIGINCARTGQAGLCVVATGLLFTPYAPSVVLTATVVGASSIATSATEGISNWVLGEKLEDLTEEDLLLAQIAWDARKEYLGINEEEERRKKQLLEEAAASASPCPSPSPSPASTETRRRNSTYQIAELARRERKEEQRRKKAEERQKKKEDKKNNKKKNGKELALVEGGEMEPEVNGVQPDWWLIPESMRGDLVKPVEEKGSSIKQSAAETLAAQGFVVASKKLGGQAGGMLSASAVSIARCTNCWKTQNANKLTARQWQSFLMTSMPALQAELSKIQKEEM